jgi:hypothetical protein
MLKVSYFRFQNLDFRLNFTLVILILRLLDVNFRLNFNWNEF